MFLLNLLINDLDDGINNMLIKLRDNIKSESVTKATRDRETEAGNKIKFI